MAVAVSSPPHTRRPLEEGAEPEAVSGRPHKWTVDEYLRIGEAGGFEDKVELIYGVIVDKWSDGETIEERRHRWTREEYERLAENGAFGDLRVELLDGKVVDMSPQGSPHNFSLQAVKKALSELFTEGVDIRVQMAFRLPGNNLLDPDLAIVPGSFHDYRRDHPSSAFILVEVASTSLRYDQNVKTAAYAAAGVPEYWIINIPHACVEVYRDPTPEGEYRTKMTVEPGDTLAPLAWPDAAIPVADLLP